MESGSPDAQGGLDRCAALLREVDHRVKNNLQLISAVIQLQSRRTADAAARQALRTAVQRVSAIAAVHRRVYRTEGREVLDLAQMVRELVADLAAAAGRDGITLQMALDAIVIDAPQGGPLALLVSELVGNALQHAFPDGRTGMVGVGLLRTADGFVLTVADDGAGVEDPAGLSRGFGLTMAQMLCQQLRATLDLTDARPGLQATVTVPMAA
ncbi:MAG: sensor histidine kinase [Phenylobacterium sp.]